MEVVHKGANMVAVAMGEVDLEEVARAMEVVKVEACLVTGGVGEKVLVMVEGVSMGEEEKG